MQWKLRDLFEIYYGMTPYIVYLHRGHTHRYMGDVNDQEALIDFAIENFHESPHIEQVPIMPTLMEELRDLFNYSVRHKNGLVAALKMENDQGEVYYSALFGVYVLPILIVWGFYKLMQLPFDAEENTVELTRELEERNEREKKRIESWIQKNPLLRRKHRKWE